MFLPKFNEIRCPGCRLSLRQTDPTTFVCTFVQCEFGEGRGVWMKGKWGLEWKKKK